MAIMINASRKAYRRILPDAMVPMQFNFMGKPTWRAPRLTAVALAPAMTGVIWLILVFIFLSLPTGSFDRTFLLRVRLLFAPGICLGHLWHMGYALKILEQEGQLGS